MKQHNYLKTYLTKSLILVSVLFAFIMQTANAQTCTWIGNNTAWDDPSNWAPSLPSINNDAVIPIVNPPFVYPEIKQNVNAQCHSLKLKDNGTGTGAQLQIDAINSASLTISDSLIIGEGASLSGSSASIKVISEFTNAATIPAKTTVPPAGTAFVPQTPFRTNANGKTQISYTAAELTNTYGWKENDVIDQISIEVGSITGGAGISNYPDFRIVAFLTNVAVVYPFPAPAATKIAVAAGDANVKAGWPKTIYNANPLTLNMPNANGGTKNNGNYATLDLIPNSFVWDGTSNLVLSFEYKTSVGATPAKNYVLYDEAQASYLVLSLNYNTVGSAANGYNIDGAGHYSGGNATGVSASVSNNRPRLDFKWHHSYQAFPITVGGNWINNGNSTNSFIAGKSNVTFNRNTDVSIQGFPTTFNQLTIDKSLGSNTVSLYADANVDSLLLLNNGRLLLKHQVLTVNNNAVDAIVRNTGAIVCEWLNVPYGYLNWNIGTNYTRHVFPFATIGGIYIPFGYKQTGGDAGYVKVFTYRSSSDNLPYPTGVTNVNDTNGVNNKAYTVNRYWLVSRTGTTGHGQLKFSFKNGEAPAPITPGNLEANSYNFSTNLWKRFNNNSYHQKNITGAKISSVVINNVPAVNLNDGVWALSDVSSPLRIASVPQPFAEIYPNPFNEFVEVNFRDNENAVVDYIIYDVMMREVSKGKLLQGESVINTQQLVAGTYIIELNKGEQKQQQKMVKL